MEMKGEERRERALQGWVMGIPSHGGGMGAR